MKKIFILFMLLIVTGVSHAMADFKRVVRLIVTETESKEIVEAVLVEIDDKKFYTNFDGMTYLDLPPGKYKVKLSKISYECEEYEIEVTEKTGIIHLHINQ